ncbi:tautomerase family protein [Alkalihalobacillus sp. CinArs1]|uniref:tautomerase family protein n=1 Tax=Alkalihalobacillus sp. CinArs1 TaxID=2995314 RepID=UPI0022DE3EBE|nr:4-oxalocrotonate tautomerase family protein [Alkalihalobacillus sp. CinArs1]
MPVVHVHITKGATRGQKEQIVREFTGTLNSVLGKEPEYTHVVIHETEEESWGFSGMLTDDFRKKQG